MSIVTIFKDFGDIVNPHYITITQALSRIKEGKSKEKVEKIRELFSKGEKYEHLKKSLPAVTYAGKATEKLKNKKGQDSYRLDKSITEHSGFIPLDFDEGDTEMYKQRLRKDTYIYACWQGVTKGVKALVKCPPNIENHSLYYNAFLARYPELDSTSKNISRLCFESYDKDLWINENSLTWDKTMTDEEWKEKKKDHKERAKNRLKNITSSMVANARDGEKHATLLRAARLLGGYVKTKLLTFDEAFDHLLEEISKRKLKDVRQAENTIRDGLDYGMSAPLHELKEIEKESDFARRDDGSYDFLASDEEMDEYEYAVVNGQLEMGLPTGVPRLDTNWMFKKFTLVWLAARDNVGKSYILWYLSVLAAMLHGWKVLMYAKENRDGAVRKKMKEFYIGKSIKLFTPQEHERASLFIKNHFRFFTAKKMHTLKDWLLKAEVIYDEGFQFDLLVGDPYNAFDVPYGEAQYTVDTRGLNLLQTFKENYSSVWISDHVTSSAAREKGNNGEMSVPTKHNTSGGQIKANKVDDFLIAHRNLKDEGVRYVTEIHVDKIKDTETGGMPTSTDDPVLMLANKDLCGFSCNGVDPVKEHWDRFHNYNSNPVPQNNSFMDEKPEPVEKKPEKQSIF